MHREEASPATATVVYEQIFARSKVADDMSSMKKKKLFNLKMSEKMGEKMLVLNRSI